MYSKLEVALFIRELAIELAKIARDEGLTDLVHLLQLVVLEAEEIQRAQYEARYKREGTLSV